MRSLPPPSLNAHDDEALYAELIARKQVDAKMALTALWPEITLRFRMYRALRTRLEALPQSPCAIRVQKAQLIALFENKPPLAALLAKVFARSPAVCPMCGEPAVPTTFDHILPKDDYAEYSVFSLNLVPCCSYCNSTKGEQFLDLATRKRLVLNPYCDTFLRAVIVRCDITAPYDAPKFDLLLDLSAISEADGEICRSHVKRVHFDLRFDAFCLGRYSQLWRELYAPHGRTQFSAMSLQQLFANKIPAASEVYGPNSWDAVFLRAVRDDEAVREFIVSEAPPKDDEAVRVRMEAAYRTYRAPR